MRGKGGIHGERGCMVKGWACMAGEACVVGVHGKGHAWRGGACVAGDICSVGYAWEGGGHA